MGSSFFFLTCLLVDFVCRKSFGGVTCFFAAAAAADSCRCSYCCCCCRLSPFLAALCTISNHWSRKVCALHCRCTDTHTHMHTHTMSPRSGDNIGRQTDRRGDGETGRQAGSQQQVQPLPKKQQKQKTAATADAYSKSLSVVRSSAPYSTVWRCCRCRCAVIVFNLLSHHHHHHLLLLLKASSHSVFSDGVQALGGSGGDGGGGEQQSWQATHSV